MPSGYCPPVALERDNMKDSLYHIEWGDGDHLFVIAPDKEMAIEGMPDGKDMVKSVTRLDALYEMIKQEGQREVAEWMNKSSKNGG